MSLSIIFIKKLKIIFFLLKFCIVYKDESFFFFFDIDYYPSLTIPFPYIISYRNPHLNLSCTFLPLPSFITLPPLSSIPHDVTFYMYHNDDHFDNEPLLDDAKFFVLKNSDHHLCLLQSSLPNDVTNPKSLHLHTHDAESTPLPKHHLQNTKTKLIGIFFPLSNIQRNNNYKQILGFLKNLISNYNPMAFHGLIFSTCIHLLCALLNLHIVNSFLLPFSMLFPPLHYFPSTLCSAISLSNLNLASI